MVLHAGPPLVVGKAEREILFTGYSRASRTVSISPEVSGRVTEVNYHVGDRIGGKPFVRIDTTFVDLGMEHTRRSLARLDVRLKSVKSRIGYLEKEFLRVDLLHKKEHATEVSRDRAAQELEQAELELEGLAADRAVLEIVLEEAGQKRLRHSITVPRGLAVTGRMVEVGEIVGPGMELARVSDYTELVVPLSVTGDELEAVRSMAGRVRGTLSGAPVDYSVRRVNPRYDEGTRKLSLELVAKNYSGERRGGLKFTLALGVATGGVTVPGAAVSRRYENPVVVLKGSGRAVPVVVLEESGGFFIVMDDKRLVPGMELMPGTGSGE
ncbi:MAG: HlyD family efflux transporter periplasmic adaptor subunit [Desulfobacteraceae bacterium]|nr:HlyD family efflux transporter periplasmic adaptor subunit [Desulfobacteraceae bacterium]